MDFNQIRKYWDERASSDSTAQSTTQDYYLREIEFRVLRDLISTYQPENVLDIGCGDGRTAARLAAEFERIRFIGGDYSESMVRNARNNVALAKISNLNIVLCDVSRCLPFEQQEMIYTTRCLINLPTWESQQTAIRNIADILGPGSYYAMIENFVEGQDNFNQVRRSFGLSEIPVREHNLFFNRGKLLDLAMTYFDVLQEANISSSYYLMSRIVYSKICQEQGVNPDYFDVHHRYAARLPFCGEYGPIRMLCLRRK